MKILTLHNKYLIRGGEDVSREAEDTLLSRKGHVIDFYIENNARVGALGLFKTSLKTIWSSESYRAIRQKLKDGNFDVVDCHNTFPLISPSAYYAASAEKIPVVQTLHNYRFLCSNSYLFRAGRVCEDCIGKPVPYPGIIHGCYRDSKMGTSVVTSMLSAHRFFQTYRQKVDLYVCVSEFARQKFIESGLLPAEKILVKPNFVDLDLGAAEGKGGFGLFVGRLSPEKGLKTLIKAWEKLNPPAVLKIVGEGPMEAEVEAAAAAKNSNIRWLGKKSTKEVYELMGEAAFLIFPSEWYETFGRVAIEAFARGTPVIASNIGAIAELVDHARTGLLFKPGDAEDLAEKIEWMLTRPQQTASMRREARAEFESKYTAEVNYKMLLKIYEQAIQMARSKYN